MGFAEAQRQYIQLNVPPPLRVVPCDLQLTDLCGEAPPRHVLGPDGLFDAVHFLLVALAVPHGVLLGLLQGVLQRLDPLGRRPQALLQLGQLAAQVCVVSDQLRSRKSFEGNTRTTFDPWSLDPVTCLWTLVSCSRLFSRKEIFCF